MKEVDLLCSTSRLVKHSAGNHNLNIENLQLTLVHGPIYETSEKFYDFIGWILCFKKIKQQTPVNIHDFIGLS